MIAALFVETNGAYFGLPHVDPYDKQRDAFTYQGPYPVVAHPPCERWGQYATGGPTAKRRFLVGDDGGAFAFALSCVRRFGGVLEHPEASKAWKAHGLIRPPFCGGWVVADDCGGWTCCVDQAWYGHLAQKSTWLYAVGCELPSMRWGRAKGQAWIGTGYNKPGAYRAAKEAGTLRQVLNLSERQRRATPAPFRDLLISIAESAKVAQDAPL